MPIAFRTEVLAFPFKADSLGILHMILKRDTTCIFQLHENPKVWLQFVRGSDQASVGIRGKAGGPKSVD